MTQQLTDADFDRLEAILEDYPESMPLDAMQGFCTALASSPKTQEKAVWQRLVLNEDGSVEPTPELANLLDRFYADAAAALAAGGEFPFLLYGMEDDPEVPDFEAWCSGYMHGFTQTPVELLEETGVEPEAIDDALHPIAFLSGVLKESIDPAMWLNEEEEKEAFEEAVEELGDAVRNLHKLFVRH